MTTTKSEKLNDVRESFMESSMSVDEKILSSTIDNYIQATTISTSQPYHTSACGALLYTSPTNLPSDIFSFLRHANFTAFQRSLEIYHKDIIRMRNEHGQTVLHILVIHAYQYVWIRLLMMRGCDTCMQDIDGYTAAHYAVERDDVEMLKALTVRFHVQARPISEEQITLVHQQCLKALSLKEKLGLTVFMLACHHESLKCINYLIELNINDSHLEDKFGDTCLHYAVARRNVTLVEKLINICHANVNGGDAMRPSALDVLQYNRHQQKPYEREKDNQIEQMLLSHNAKNRCSVQSTTNKRKETTDYDDSILSHLACITLDTTSEKQLETGRMHARVASSLHIKGDLDGAEENYTLAMTCTPERTIDWTTYAFNIAIIHMVRGERQLALEFLQKARDIRKQFENHSPEIDQIQRAIDNIQ